MKRLKIKTLTTCAVLEYIRQLKRTTGETKLEVAYVEIKQELEHDNPMWLPDRWYGNTIDVEIANEDDDYLYVTENNLNYFWLPKIYIEEEIKQ